MRKKRPITVHGLRGSIAGNGGVAGDPWRFVLTFECATGPGTNPGREGCAVLTMAEVAQVIGSIPASVCDGSAEDLKAIIRLTELLREKS